MMNDKIRKLAGDLYEGANYERFVNKLGELMRRYSSLSGVGYRSSLDRKSAGVSSSRFIDERDVLLITYADTLRQAGVMPLKSLGEFSRRWLGDLISFMHILPFFPYSSDDGFSVIDYRRVNSEFGSWFDIEHLGQDIKLCFDLVLNHTSSQSAYFKGFLAGDDKYRDYFITLPPDTDTSSVVRPRTSPLLHKYKSQKGDVWCWTTFSEDQIDFNFHNPDVLLEMLDVVLFYISRGACMIRLDAIAYAWKELGTSCVHLRQVHSMVKLMRAITEQISPWVLLLAEINFPLADNLSYLGSGNDEAHLIYNFPLPPLVLFTLATGNAKYLNQWAAGLKELPAGNAFLNFTASHDGIGVRPVADILSDDEMQMLINLAIEHNGRVSYKKDNTGRDIAYELNINYFDAINNPNDRQLSIDLQVDRFMISQSIALVLQGMPAVYIHSLLGSRNWDEGPGLTGINRSINREKLDMDEVERQLNDGSTLRSRVYSRYKKMLSIRSRERAFCPTAGQAVLDIGDNIFGLLRVLQDGLQAIIALHNVSADNCEILLSNTIVTHAINDAVNNTIGQLQLLRLTDLLNGDMLAVDSVGNVTVKVAGFQTRWLKLEFES